MSFNVCLYFVYDLPPKACDAFFNMTTIRVSNPDSPNVYPADNNCVYTLENAVGACLRVAFTVFDLGSNSEDCEDYVEVGLFFPFRLFRNSFNPVQKDIY